MTTTGRLQENAACTGPPNALQNAHHITNMHELSMLAPLVAAVAARYQSRHVRRGSSLDPLIGRLDTEASIVSRTEAPTPPRWPVSYFLVVLAITNNRSCILIAAGIVEKF